MSKLSPQSVLAKGGVGRDLGATVEGRRRGAAVAVFVTRISLLSPRALG